MDWLHALFPAVPRWLQELLTWGPPAVLWAWLGRFAFHVHRHMKGRGRLRLSAVLCETPVAVFLGLTASGLADVLGLTGRAEVALVAIVAWQGPDVLADLFARLARIEIERRGPRG